MYHNSSLIPRQVKLDDYEPPVEGNVVTIVETSDLRLGSGGKASYAVRGVLQRIHMIPCQTHSLVHLIVQAYSFLLSSLVPKQFPYLLSLIDLAQSTIQSLILAKTLHCLSLESKLPLTSLTILDLGCGIGFLGIYLAKLGAKVLLADQEWMHERVEDNIKINDLEVKAKWIETDWTTARPIRHDLTLLCDCCTLASLEDQLRLIGDKGCIIAFQQKGNGGPVGVVGGDEQSEEDSEDQEDPQRFMKYIPKLKEKEKQGTKLAPIGVNSQSNHYEVYQPGDKQPNTLDSTNSSPPSFENHKQVSQKKSNRSMYRSLTSKSLEMYLIDNIMQFEPIPCSHPDYEDDSVRIYWVGWKGEWRWWDQSGPIKK